MTKPLTERLRELQRKGYGPVGLAKTCGEAAKALEEARYKAICECIDALTKDGVGAGGDRGTIIDECIDTLRALKFPGPEARESPPEAKRTTPRS